MKTFKTTDNGASYTVAEADSFLTTLFNGLKNPFTGHPSSQAEQWFTIGYTAVASVVLSAIFFKSMGWFKKIGELKEKNDAKKTAQLRTPVSNG